MLDRSLLTVVYAVAVFFMLVTALSMSGCGGPEVMPELPCEPQLVCPGAVSINANLALTVDGTKAAYFECEGICANGHRAWMFFPHADEGATCDSDRAIWQKWVIDAVDC